MQGATSHSVLLPTRSRAESGEQEERRVTISRKQLIEVCHGKDFAFHPVGNW